LAETISNIPGTWTSAIDASSVAAAASKKKSNGLDMQGFLKLMAAQMQNQSLTSEADDTQYITQLTLFTAIQAINNQTMQATKQYASSLVGKNVHIHTTDTLTGIAKDVTGTVSKAIFSSSSGDCTIQVGDQTYDVSDVVEILDSENAQSNSEPTEQNI
jgi:flagellar basal-body rod modification protein FlgD